MLVLGIETTCDETAAAVVRRDDTGLGEILSNVVLSQIAEHAAFGGVVPEIAARAHVEVLDRVIATAMAEAKTNFAVLAGIAAAAGPGLIGGVIVGLTTAKAIALVAEKAQGDGTRFTLPRPMLGRVEPDFSLSGLKTALRLEAEKIAPVSDQDVADLCASFQQAIVDVVSDRVSAGLRLFRERYGGPTALVAAGGVAANQAIRRALNRVAIAAGTVLIVPPPALCTDNGAMIAWAGAERLARGMTDTLAASPRARWPLDMRASTSGANPKFA